MVEIWLVIGRRSTQNPHPWLPHREPRSSPPWRPGITRSSGSPGLSFSRNAYSRFLGLSKTDLAQLTGIAVASVRFDAKISRMLRERLMDFAAICELVAQAFEGNTTKTALWFITPNPQLNNVSPCELLRRGGRDTLQRVVIEAMAGARQ